METDALERTQNLIGLVTDALWGTLITDSNIEESVALMRTVARALLDAADHIEAVAAREGSLESDSRGQAQRIRDTYGPLPSASAVDQLEADQAEGDRRREAAS